MISMLERQLVLSNWTNNTGAISVKMDRSAFEQKSSFRMPRLTFSSKFDWVSRNISISKTASKRIAAWIDSMKFVFPEVALHFYNSARRPSMEYCCHVCAGFPSCFAELLDKLQKLI